MVQKLNLPRVPHDLPYRAYGLGDEQWIDVFEKLYVSFNIGPYFDTIECDIMPLKYCHLILGREWQYDRSTIYDCRENTYTINKDGKKMVLFPLKDDETWKESRSLGLIDRIAFPMHDEVKEVLVESNEIMEKAAIKSADVCEVGTPISTMTDVSCPNGENMKCRKNINCNKKYNK